MIEVGEYIRTDKGKLGRVIRVWESEYKHDRTRYLVDWGNGRATYISQIKNVKHSKNIIDLIEVGDIVNGIEVIDIDNFREGDIETILTHEMYEQNCYKVGVENE